MQGTFLPYKKHFSRQISGCLSWHQGQKIFANYCYFAASVVFLKVFSSELKLFVRCYILHDQNYNVSLYFIFFYFLNYYLSQLIFNPNSCYFLHQYSLLYCYFQISLILFQRTSNQRFLSLRVARTLLLVISF